MTAVLLTSHLVDSDASAVDRDGRALIVGRPYAWRGQREGRRGLLVRVEPHGRAVLVTHDEYGETVVSATYLRLCVEETSL